MLGIVNFPTKEAPWFNWCSR